MTNLLGNTLKSIVKILLLWRPVHFKAQPDCGKPLNIMGNGPSLRQVLDSTDIDLLRDGDTMAVNFAANTPEFYDIRPRYYTLADPHFFDYGPRGHSDPNVTRLFDALSHVDWPMTLYVPARQHRVAKKMLAASNPRYTVSVNTYNALGIEGFTPFVNFCFSHKIGMPRPRNVLIPSIMIGCWLGYRDIILYGADHTWTRTLWVDDDNKVITNQPHFYADNDEERGRVKRAYATVPLHELLYSFHLAFKGYHIIQRWARRHHINILNATPGSFIDAFPRQYPCTLT